MMAYREVQLAPSMVVITDEQAGSRVWGNPTGAAHKSHLL